jgi:hypothetical protein
MATSRPTPSSYYYSGQGRVLMGKRDVNGKGYGFRHVGNCTALSVEIAIEKFEHKESQSGQRAIDLTVVKEKKATVKFTAESLSLDNLALGLFGEVVNVSAGSAITNEEHKFLAGGVGIALDKPNVSAVSVKTGANSGTATAVTADKYRLDPEFGMIYPLDDTAFTGANVYVNYTPGAVKRLDIFTKSFAEEVFLRFEGLNTVNEDLVLVNIPRVAFDPLPASQLITEEIGSIEFTGNVLQDTTISSGSQFMTQTIIDPA